MICSDFFLGGRVELNYIVDIRIIAWVRYDFIFFYYKSVNNISRFQHYISYIVNTIIACYWHITLESPEV